MPKIKFAERNEIYGAEESESKIENFTYIAGEVVARALSVELTEAIADEAAWLVVGDELLGHQAAGSSISHVDSRDDRRGNSLGKDLSQKVRLRNEELSTLVHKTPST